MKQDSITEIIEDQTIRALWEVENVIECIPEEMWNKEICNMPIWKHVYHMLHSLDLWFINPNDQAFQEPFFHEKDLNNLDVSSNASIDRATMKAYFVCVKDKMLQYVSLLKEPDLLTKPDNCEYTKFTLIVAQFRHLHSHMGMLMGYIQLSTGLWPKVLGLTGEIPKAEYDKYC